LRLEHDHARTRLTTRHGLNSQCHRPASSPTNTRRMFATSHALRRRASRHEARMRFASGLPQCSCAGIPYRSPDCAPPCRGRTRPGKLLAHAAQRHATCASGVYAAPQRRQVLTARYASDRRLLSSETIPCGRHAVPRPRLTDVLTRSAEDAVLVHESHTALGPAPAISMASAGRHARRRRSRRIWLDRRADCRGSPAGAQEFLHPFDVQVQRVRQGAQDHCGLAGIL